MAVNQPWEICPPKSHTPSPVSSGSLIGTEMQDPTPKDSPLPFAAKHCGLPALGPRGPGLSHARGALADRAGWEREAPSGSSIRQPPWFFVWLVLPRPAGHGRHRLQTALLCARLSLDVPAVLGPMGFQRVSLPCPSHLCTCCHRSVICDTHTQSSQSALGLGSHPTEYTSRKGG